MFDDNEDTTNVSSAVLDLIVVGGGVVGLAVARHAAALAGYNVAVVEQEADLLVWASGSNSGIICTGVDASIGTLERALIRDSLAQLRTFYREMNLPLRPCGSLVCQWDWDEDCSTRGSTDSESESSLQRIWRESHDAGDTNAQLLTPAQVLAMEPHLNPKCRGAVHIPGEIVVDPWLHGIACAVHARQNGAQIYTDFPVDVTTSSFDQATKIWTVRRKRQLTVNSCRAETSSVKASAATKEKLPTELRARVVVNAAGLWADLVQRDMLGDEANNPPWDARPRRGQYRVFQYNRHRYDHNNNNGHKASPLVLTHPIQPIPTSHTKGIFVFSTLYNHIVVGPTAIDQSSRTDRSTDPETAQQLENTLHRILQFSPAPPPHAASPPPSSQSKTTPKTCSSIPAAVVVGDYVGIRPGSNHRDYQIHLIPNQHWLTCAGIRSTGLTASLGIGRHAVQLLQSAGILSSTSDCAMQQQHTTKTEPLPHVSALARAYRESGNRESITIDGYEYRVTHPLTRWGWAAGTGLAAATAAQSN